MSTHLLLECPRCEAQRLFPGSPSTEQLKNAIASHLAQYHPSMLPAESERAIKTAVSSVEPRAIEDEADVTVQAWDDYGI